MMPTGAVSTANDPIDPELVERFRAALARLNPEGGRIGLAVSGGPDSMAMLLLAHAAIPGKFEVATVDHGLRPEAKDECALVVAACEERGIPCEVLTVQVGDGNVQAMAREARYDALASWAVQKNLAAVATAHHADDQAETLLMRLNRGSGVAGLAGVRERTILDMAPDIAVIRPLLGFRRSELARSIEQAGLEVANDPSNRDDRFDRVRIREALASADWIDPLALSRSASYLADADEFLSSGADLTWPNIVERSGDTIKIIPNAHRAILLRIVERAIRELGGEPRGSDVSRLLDRLERCEGGNVAGVLASVEGKWGDLEPPRWVFRPEPPRKTG
jgi:tRNA(Ile)-lysidine synthase